MRLCLKSKKQRKERNIDTNDNILCNVIFYIKVVWLRVEQENKTNMFDIFFISVKLDLDPYCMYMWQMIVPNNVGAWLGYIIVWFVRRNNTCIHMYIPVAIKREYDAIDYSCYVDKMIYTISCEKNDHKI